MAAKRSLGNKGTLFLERGREDFGGGGDEDGVVGRRVASGRTRFGERVNGVGVGKWIVSA